MAEAVIITVRVFSRATCCTASADRRHRQIDDRIDTGIVPGASERSGDIRLVLRVRMHNLNRTPKHGWPEILRRHAGREDRAGTTAIGVGTIFVRQHAHTDRTCRMASRSSQRTCAGQYAASP